MHYTQNDEPLLVCSWRLHEWQHQSVGADLWSPWDVCPAPMIIIMCNYHEYYFEFAHVWRLDYQAEAIAMSVVKPKVYYDTASVEGSCIILIL